VLSRPPDRSGGFFLGCHTCAIEHADMNAIKGEPIMKSVVITGASTGIGWAAAKLLLDRGFRVFGSVRKTGRRRPPQKRIRHEFHAADVRRHR
jgi:NADP-dependent 3-hydroxy acid dehydrogenase YdfG